MKWKKSVLLIVISCSFRKMIVSVFISEPIFPGDIRTVCAANIKWN